MQKIRYFLLLFVFVLASCESDTGAGSNERVSQVLNMKGDAQRLAYFALEPNDKMEVWKIHFEQMKKNNKYTEIQNQFINEIGALLKEEYFMKGNSEFKFFSKYIRVKGSKIFKSKQLFDLIASLDSAMKTDGGGGGVPPLMGNCTCSTGDDWCIWGSTCTGTAFCKYDSSGCGTMFGEPCNGVCQQN